MTELLPTSQKEFDPRTSLAWGDVAIDSYTNPQMVQIHLKKSKCDQLGKGVDIVLGKSDTKVCPVLAIVSMRKKFPTGTFFLTSTGKPAVVY